MRVLLISPRAYGLPNGRRYGSIWSEELEGQVERNLWRCPDIGLLTVAALSGEEAELEYLDENLVAIGPEHRADVVAITAVTQQARRAYDLAAEFRARGAHTVIGGVHATMMPEEARRHFDTVILGEAERSWPRFLADHRAGRAQPIYRDLPVGSVDVCASPIPRFDLVAPGRYDRIPIQTSRGCPHGCEFCNLPELYGKRYRKKGIGQTVAEVKAALGVARNRCIYFTDDNFFVDKGRSRALLAELVPLALKWVSHCDISIGADDELLSLAKRSGAQELLIGLESTSAESLTAVNGWKAGQLKHYVEYVRNIQAHGIGVVGSFVLGFDGDDEAVFDRVRDFIVDNNLYGASVTVQTPFPGTRLYQRLEREGRILSRDWNEYTIFEVTFRPDRLSVEGLRSGALRLLGEVNGRDAVLRKLKHFKALARAAAE